MARKFAERGEPLDILISSTATRAWATASLVSGSPSRADISSPDRVRHRICPE